MVKVFSDNLGDALGISSSLVRKDFRLGLTGNKRGGYQVDDLIEKMEAIFGRNEDKDYHCWLWEGWYGINKL